MMELDTTNMCSHLKRELFEEDGQHLPHKGMELLIDRESAEERIETGRLILRPWRESDAESLFRYACDPDVGPRAGWPPHKDIEESRRVIRDIFTNDRTWAVTLPHSVV